MFICHTASASCESLAKIMSVKQVKNKQMGIYVIELRRVYAWIAKDITELNHGTYNQ